MVSRPPPPVASGLVSYPVYVHHPLLYHEIDNSLLLKILSNFSNRIDNRWAQALKEAGLSLGTIATIVTMTTYSTKLRITTNAFGPFLGLAPY